VSDEPQAPSTDQHLESQVEDTQSNPEVPGDALGDRRVQPTAQVGDWTAVEIPEGHYLKDGKLYWDHTSKPYREMCSPPETGGPHVA
jgi:hypothetical protein